MNLLHAPEININLIKIQIFAAKELKLRIQNMAILQTLHWALPLWNYHSGTAPGRIFHAVAATSSIFSSDENFLPQSQSTFGTKFKHFLEEKLFQWSYQAKP